MGKKSKQICRTKILCRRNLLSFCIICIISARKPTNKEIVRDANIISQRLFVHIRERERKIKREKERETLESLATCSNNNRLLHNINVMFTHIGVVMCGCVARSRWRFGEPVVLGNWSCNCDRSKKEKIRYGSPFTSRTVVKTGLNRSSFQNTSGVTEYCVRQVMNASGCIEILKIVPAQLSVQKKIKKITWITHSYDFTVKQDTIKMFYVKWNS